MDGSLDPESGWAGAAFVRIYSIIYSIRTSDGASTLQTELVAILHALSDAEDLPNRPPQQGRGIKHKGKPPLDA